MFKNLFKSALITVATATLSISAVADQGDPVNSMGQEVDVSFENSQVRLMGEG